MRLVFNSKLMSEPRPSLGRAENSRPCALILRPCTNSKNGYSFSYRGTHANVSRLYIRVDLFESFKQWTQRCTDLVIRSCNVGEYVVEQLFKEFIRRAAAPEQAGKRMSKCPLRRSPQNYNRVEAINRICPHLMSNS